MKTTHDFGIIESLFSELLAATTETLTDVEWAEVQSFIDVGEYGLALDTIVDIFSEERKKATNDVVSLIQRLASEMSLEPAAMLRRLSKSSDV